MKSKSFVYTAAAMLLSFSILGNAHGDMASLDELLGGGSLTDGGTTYSNFQLLMDIGTVSIDPALISVETLSMSGGLEISSMDPLNLDAGSDSIIYQFSFDAETVDTLWTGTGADLSQGNAIVAGDGLIDLFNQTSDPLGASLGDANAILDPSFGFNDPTGFAAYGSNQDSVSVVSSLSIFADGSSSVSLQSYRVSLTTIPEPTSAGLIGLISIFATSRRSRSKI